MASYNNYKFMPYIPYKIIEYLAENNENLWKILKYNTYDCLSEDDLTFDEKMKLIWKNQDKQENYHVFFTDLIENSIPSEGTILKIYKYFTIPQNNINADGLYEFDILYGGKISLIDYNGYPCNRGDVCEAEILSTLNGVNVGGVGNLEFNRQKSSMSKSGLNIGDNKSYTGTSLIMVTNMSNIGDEDYCR